MARMTTMNGIELGHSEDDERYQIKHITSPITVKTLGRIMSEHEPTEEDLMVNSIPSLSPVPSCEAAVGYTPEPRASIISETYNWVTNPPYRENVTNEEAEEELDRTHRQQPQEDKKGTLTRLFRTMGREHNNNKNSGEMSADSKRQTLSKMFKLKSSKDKPDDPNTPPHRSGLTRVFSRIGDALTGGNESGSRESRNLNTLGRIFNKENKVEKTASGDVKTPVDTDEKSNTIGRRIAKAFRSKASGSGETELGTGQDGVNEDIRQSNIAQTEPDIATDTVMCFN